MIPQGLALHKEMKKRLIDMDMTQLANELGVFLAYLIFLDKRFLVDTIKTRAA